MSKRREDVDELATREASQQQSAVIAIVDGK
jgi:hypothetical protein